jgi:predicted enzyme related to lactoylglutathione lyase
MAGPRRPAAIFNFEIQADDAASLASFYRAVFGWSITRFAAPEKWGLPATFMIANASRRGPIHGRIDVRNETTPRVNGFLCSVRVASLERTAKAVVRNGGTVISELPFIPKVGGHLFIGDPAGNVVLAVQFPGDRKWMRRTTSNKRMQLTRSAKANGRRGPRS